MQLTLDTVTAVDVNTTMSEDNVEKCVLDILTVKNGVTNGDVANESNESTEIKDSDVETIEKIKHSVIRDTVNVLEHGDDTTLGYKNTDLETVKDGSNEVLLTTNENNFSNKDQNSVLDTDPISDKVPIKEDDTKNDCPLIEKEDNQNGTENTAHENMHDSNSTLKQPDGEVSKKNTESESSDKTSETLNPNITNSVSTSDPCESVNITENSLDSGSINDVNLDAHPSESVNIKKEYEETTATADENMDINEELDIKREIVQENTQDEEFNSKPHQESHEPALADTSDNEFKQQLVKTETSENTPLSPKQSEETGETKVDTIREDLDMKKEITEINTQGEELNSDSPQVSHEPALADTNGCSTTKTDTTENTSVSEINEKEISDTEIDVSDENIDLIRLDVGISLEDKPNFLLCDTGEEVTSVDKQEEKASLKTGDVTEMEVDVSRNNSGDGEKDKNESDSITPASNTEIAEIVDSNQSKGGGAEAPQHDTQSSDSVIVNLDDDKDKLIGSLYEETEPTIAKAGEQNTEVIENAEKPVGEDQMSVDEIIDLDEPKDSQDSELSDKENNKKESTNKTTIEEPKPIEPILKLSNTLDILSDDEEEVVAKTAETDNKCINIEDDDDIMLIDDDTSGNESKSDPIKETALDKQIETKPESLTESTKVTEECKKDDVQNVSDKDAPVPEKEVTVLASSPDISEKAEENKLEAEIRKPLIPENFLKTCKKNLADMTRDELEEFCVLKLVESILDRSNLSEIKNKLKTLTQNLEEYKKKAMMLSKQNRDLQVVFKSVQEDVKKTRDSPIVPLKITRSVGMQVLMSDKVGDKRRRQGIPNSVINKPVRNPVPQGPRAQKPPTQPIPVPRLVPANSPAAKSPQQVASKVTSPLPNGVKNVVSPAPPAQKGEKRTHNRLQSVTVDLTDDEPPTKLQNRTGPMPPVRLVPSQNLLATPRAPSQVNSPRKVYIPISGPQGQNVRPGQTIMLKTVPAANPRPRVPPPHMVRMPQSIRMTRPQGLRHPAPLPECMKQYQPPNWKALPPAPDLKLAKVENGIVISWKIEGYQEDSYEEIASYQLYAYQETTSPPNTALWKKIGDVKALPLPMACTLTQFMAGYKYYFAVRAVDIRSRLGPFSLPGSILLLNKM